MILRIDHVSLAVKDYDKANEFFDKLFGAIPGASASMDGANYRWQILSVGDLSRLELISPTDKGSFLDGFLKNRDGGVHHITFQTSDIKKVKKHLEDNDIPYFGYNEYPGGVWNELFIHPKHAFGVLIQIAEFKASEWLNPSVAVAGDKKWKITPTSAGADLSIAHPGGGTVDFSLDKDELQSLIKDLSGAL